MGNLSTALELDIVESKVIKEGYLLKQSVHFKTFRKRWMVLFEGQGILMSYKSNLKNERTEILDLSIYNQIEPFNADDSTISTRFKLISSDGHREFEASKNDDMLNWVNCIRKAQLNINSNLINIKTNVSNATNEKFDSDDTKCKGYMYDTNKKLRLCILHECMIEFFELDSEKHLMSTPYDVMNVLRFTDIKKTQATHCDQYTIPFSIELINETYGHKVIYGFEDKLHQNLWYKSLKYVI
eukprot:15659_1